MTVMKFYATCSDVLVCIIYNKKPVHFISIVADNFKWAPIKNKVYSKIEKKTVYIKFHRLNVGERCSMERLEQKKNLNHN